MRWIDFKNKKPIDGFDGWAPWPKEKWDAWIAESTRLLAILIKLNGEAIVLEKQGKDEEAKVKIAERNKTIDDNASHWGMLKPWLFALSHGKCWFTEAKDIASHQDVEHFRPKKEALNLHGAARDGYWWLAFDYSNFRAAGNVPNRKKGGWFPLHNKSPCSQFDARCEETEEPYLLDPISPTDPNLLAFDEEGNAIPTPTADPWEKERAKLSIERLKLNDHDALPDERRKIWQKTSNAIESFLKAKAAYKPVINPVPKETMAEKAREIHSLSRPDAELSAVARWCVLFRNDPDLARLVS